MKGAFGGAQEESGKADPLALLLMYNEVLKRYQKFLDDVSESQTITALAVIKINNCKSYIDICIKKVFNDFNIERAENRSLSCLEKLTENCV